MLVSLGKNQEGGRTSSKKKLHSILKYMESSRGFAEIKQISAHSIQVCRGNNAWNTFVLRVEHPYIVGKSDLDMGEPTFHAEKTACDQLQHVLALVRQLLSKTAQKALNKGCSAWNQTVSLRIASSDC